MRDFEVRDLTPEFGVQITGFDPQAPFDCETLRDLFDRRGVLVFRDLSISHAQQVELCTMLIRAEDESGPRLEDTFYISNRRPKSAAPYGRLQFHSDTMWSSQPFEVLSLYALDVEQPAVPTTFVSAIAAWTRLPAGLRERVRALDALHTAGEVQRGDLTDVLVSTVERPPCTTTPIGHRHPRTGETILYVCEQMTKAVVGLEPGESERLLEELFAILYDPSHHLDHHWRNGDLVVWDNVAVQHGRPNVDTGGPARTLRKFAHPIPPLDRDERPTYRASA